MAAGADVIYQADILRRPLAGVRRLSPPRRRAGAAIEVGAVPLRGRRHEARPPREGRRRPPDLLVRRPAERIQGVRPAQMKVVLGGSARETASLRMDDYMAYYRAAKPRFEAAVLVARRPSCCRRRRRRPIRSRSSTATCAAGRRCAHVVATTTTSRSWPASPPGSAPRSPHARSTRSFGSPMLPCRSIRRSTAPARRASSASGSRHGSRSPGAPAEADPRAHPSRAGGADRAGARTGHAPAAGRRRPLPRPRGRPVRVRRRRGLPLRGARPGGAFTPIWSFDPDRPGEVSLAGEKAAFERLDRPAHRPARSPSRDARLPLRQPTSPRR